MSKYPLIYKLKDDHNTDYTALSNKPTINAVTLTGALSSSDLGLVDTETIGALTDLTTETQSSIVAATNEINAKFPVSVANGGTGGTTATEARTNLGVRTAEQLYYNAEGSAATIELSSSIENYDMLQIFYWTYHDGKWLESKTIYNNHVSSVTAVLNATFSAALSSKPNRLLLYSHNIFINGDTLTWGNMYTANLTDTDLSVVDTEANTFKISRVFGYKY